MKTILCTGGCGYIGSHTVKALSQAGYKVVVTDNRETGEMDITKWAEFDPYDIRHPFSVKRLMEEFKFDAVMHFAAKAYVEESIQDPKAYYENNLIGLLNLLYTTGNIPFIFSSSCAVYGEVGFGLELSLKENDSKNPISPYGRTKLMAEQILQDYHKAYGLPYIALRYFNAAGADPDGELGECHDPETHLIPLAIKAAMDGTPLKVNGTDYLTEDGTCLRDFVHVTDIADAHVKALRYLFNDGSSQAINLGSTQSHSIMQVIREVEKTVGKPIKIEIGARREGDPVSLQANSQRALEVLGWVPKYSSLPVIIQTAYEWEKRRRSSAT